MPAAEAKARVYTVSELNAELRDCLEGRFPEVWLEGEISNFKTYPSGHSYFSLKDASGQIKAVLFKGSAMGVQFAPQDGLKVLARARVSVYPARGDLQLIVSRMEPREVGALKLAFDQLKARLEREGLFAPERKRALPPYPRTVGVVTSLQGAAVRDILRVVMRRWEGLSVLIMPARVQGEGAALEIAQAIRDFNDLAPETDVLLVGRGGGSLEDLWAFNEEPVARAIAASRIPVVSCVGHETDFTIADFVADLRAPTPSAAAEMAVPEKARALATLEDSSARMRQALGDRLASLERRLAYARSHPLLQKPGRLYELRIQRVDELAARLGEALGSRLSHAEKDLRLFAGKLDALSPLKVLGRGYAIARRLPGLEVLRSAGSASAGDKIQVRLNEGELRCEVLP